jgi:hypothetical protein
VSLYIVRQVESLLSGFSEIEIPRVFCMPTFLMISRHSPENCPMFNEKTRKVMMECMDKIDGTSEEIWSQKAWKLDCP